MPKRRRSSLKSSTVGRQDDRLDPGRVRPVDQTGHRAVAGRIVVADDVEPAQRRREQDGGEMRGRERRHHRHVGQDAAKRQHGLDAFAGGRDVARHTEADRVAEEIAHRPPRRVDRRLAERVGSKPFGSSQVRCAPVIRPSRSVTAAIIAGQVSVGACRDRADSSSADGSAGFRFRAKP